MARYPLIDWQKQNRFEIYLEWRHRYAPGVTHNQEHVFAVEVPRPLEITIAPREHLAYAWLPWREAAERAFSWSNAEAVRELPHRLAAQASHRGELRDFRPVALRPRQQSWSGTAAGRFFGALW